MTRMLLLLMMAVPARAAVELRAEPERRLHLLLDATFLYGIGGQSALGVAGRLSGFTPVWNTRLATGTIDVGVQLSYANEPTWAAPWINPEQTEGANHRVQLLATVGHSFHFGAKRRVAFGVHLFGGLNHWRSSYTVRYNNEGVKGSASLDRDHFVSGAELRLTARLHRLVALHLTASAPFPYESSYVVGIFNVGVGLGFLLR